MMPATVPWPENGNVLYGEAYRSVQAFARYGRCRAGFGSVLTTLVGHACHRSGTSKARKMSDSPG